MPRSDAIAGAGLAVLGAAVLWSARVFPNVPGQKLGAAFLPMLVGAVLLVCALALIVRGLRAAPLAAGASAASRPEEHFGSAAVVIAAVIGYLLLAERIGFPIVAPLLLLVVFRAFRVGWVQAAAWAIGGTLLVHVAFYKLLRVPLPWGIVPPLY